MKDRFNNETGPIIEKQSFLNKLHKQKYILEAQGLLNNINNFTQYTYIPNNESWENAIESFKKFGQSAQDTLKALEKLVEVWQNDTNKRFNS